jgi:hypothetical protein
MQITINPTTANLKFGGKQKFTASDPGVFSIQTEIGSTIDKDGNYTAGQPQLVDAGGQRVNAAGQPVNTAGQPVNAAGQPVDAAGQPIAGRVNASGQQVDAAGQIIAGQPVPAGQRVNAAGQPVNDAGQVIPASQPVKPGDPNYNPNQNPNRNPNRNPNNPNDPNRTMTSASDTVTVTSSKEGGITKASATVNVSK